jgi:hypothetical protein
MSTRLSGGPCGEDQNAFGPMHDARRRCGSVADILRCEEYVRFTTESGHWQRKLKCPLWARQTH